MTDDEIDNLPLSERYAARGVRRQWEVATLRTSALATEGSTYPPLLDALPHGVVRMLPSMGWEVAPYQASEWPRQ